MNAALRTLLVRGGLLVGGGVAGASGTVALQSTSAAPTGVYDTITVSIEDTITPRHTVKTDSILAVVSTPSGQRIVAKKCGLSYVFFRAWIGAMPLTADTNVVRVPCATQLVLLDQPPDTVYSDSLLPPMRVELRDANNKLVRQSGVLVTVTLNGPGVFANGQRSIQVYTDANGVATAQRYASR